VGYQTKCGRNVEAFLQSNTEEYLHDMGPGKVSETRHKKAVTIQQKIDTFH
jgi:hypothetical protein